jgi:hypothetical protein
MEKYCRSISPLCVQDAVRYEIYAVGCPDDFSGTDDVFEYQNKLKDISKSEAYKNL